MRISILIPTIDRLAYLRESLAAAQQQTHADLEILVSDDCGTAGPLVHEAARTDSRVRLLPTNPQKGLYENYNYLLDHATGDAFGICDDDDRWLPDMVARLAAPLERNDDLVATFCDHWIISAEGDRLAAESDANSNVFGRAGLPEGIVSDPLSVTMRGGMSAVFALFRTRAFGKERFDLACAGAADLDYAIRAALKGKIHYVDARLGEYRAHDRRTTATATAWLLSGVAAVLEKHSFSGTAQEQLRLALLRECYRRNALYTCTRNPPQSRAFIRKHAASGGSSLHPAVVLSIVLAALPDRLASFVWSALKSAASYVRARQ